MNTKQVSKSKPFDPTALSTPGMFLTIAKKYSGKTHLMKYIIGALARAKRFNYGIIVSGTAETGEWNIVPKRQIFSNWDDAGSKIEKVITRQKQLQAEGKPLPSIFLVLDDIVGVVNANSGLMSQLASMSRHWNMTLFVCVQSVTKIPPLFRQNAEYLFAFKQNNIDQIKVLYAEFGGAFGTSAEFVDYMQKNVHTYRALMINIKTQSPKKEDIFKLVIAPPNPAKYFIK